MSGLFDGLATQLAQNAQKIGMPGAGGASPQQKPGLFGLGGPGVGLIDKFSSMFGGSGNAGAATKKPGLPAFQAGGEITGGDNPYEAQVHALDVQIEAAKNSIMQSFPKEQWQTAMEESVLPLMRKRQELATMSQEWVTQNPPNANVTGGQEIPGGMEAPAVPAATDSGGGAGMPKARKIIIEENPITPK